MPDSVDPAAAGIDTTDEQMLPEQYRDRPTFGQRVGAKKSGVQQSPEGARQKLQHTQGSNGGAAPQVSFDYGNLPPGILPAASDSPMPTTPSLRVQPPALPNSSAGRGMTDRMLRIGPGDIPKPQQDPNRQGLIQRSAELSNITNPNQPKYRMGIGSRLLGALSNAASGFARSGQAPVYVGPGATNRQYSVDEARRQAELGGVRTQLGDVEKSDEYKRKLYEDATKQAYEGEVGEARLQTGQAAEDRVRAYGELGEAKNEINRLKADQGQQKLDMNSPAGRQQTADQYGLKGTARQDYILTGKLPKDMMGATPRQPTEMELWMQAFQRDNGRPPTAEEIAQRHSRDDMERDRITKDRDKALADAEKKAEQRIAKMGAVDLSNPLRKGESTAQYMERRKQQVYADLEKEKAAAVRDYQERSAQLDQKRGNTGQRAAKQQGPPNTNARPNDQRVRVREKATGRVGTMPQSQLKQAVASGRYEEAQ